MNNITCHFLHSLIREISAMKSLTIALALIQLFILHRIISISIFTIYWCVASSLTCTHQPQRQSRYSGEIVVTYKTKTSGKINGRERRRTQEEKQKADEQRKRKEEEGETQRQEKAQELINESNNKKKHRKREHTWKRQDKLICNPASAHHHFPLTDKIAPIPPIIPVLVLLIFRRMSSFPHFYYLHLREKSCTTHRKTLMIFQQRKCHPLIAYFETTSCT